MTKQNQFLFNLFTSILILQLIVMSGCKDAMESNPKYQFPDWLEGKVYDVAKSKPELSIFTECLDKTGIGQIINSSGLYTVMAPTNDAFKAYFASHPKYNSIDDIDSLTLRNLVESHIVLMPYSKKQLRTLDFGGWIEDSNTDPQYLCFKRKTFYQPENLEIKVGVDAGGVISTINSNGNAVRKVYSAYNKYAPIFYREHLSYVGISSSDFEYYFGRSFEQPEVYFGGAKLITIINEDKSVTESFSAENGYVYMVDQVVEPMQNGYENLFNDDPNRPKYSQFGNLIDEFATLTYNKTATYDQPGATEGLSVDMLYDLNYPSLAYNIYSESTYGSYEQFSLAIHNGLFAPTDAAYNSFVSQVITKNDLEHYMNMSQVPANIKRFIVNSHMIKWSPFYPSLSGQSGKITDYNGNKVDISGIGVAEKKFGSNVTFVGLDKVIMPELLSSVVAPVLLRPSYSSFYWALFASNATDILQTPSVDYTLFAIPNLTFEKDSTLYVEGITNNFKSNPSVSRFRIWDKGNNAYLALLRRSTVDNLSLQGLVYGQIGIGRIKGNCRKEFIRNLLGHFIIIDNENKTVSGNGITTSGYNGGEFVTLKLDKKLEEDYGIYGKAPKNGSTYSIDGWLQFSNICFSETTIESYGGTKFLSLMKRVGMVNSLNKIAMLNEGEVFTLFLPTDAALEAAQVDAMSDDKLKELLQAHFVLGVNAFTDNINKNPLSTKYYTKNGKRLSLSSSASDELNILSKTGEVYYKVTENGSTNIMFLGWDNGNENDGSTYSNKILAGIAVVVHRIDVVIKPEDVLE